MLPKVSILTSDYNSQHYKIFPTKNKNALQSYKNPEIERHWRDNTMSKEYKCANACIVLGYISDWQIVKICKVNLQSRVTAVNSGSRFYWGDC